MAGVPRGRDELQLPASQIQDLPALQRDHPLLGDGLQRPVVLERGPQGTTCALQESLGAGQVRQPSLMNVKPSLREAVHEEAGAACVVQVDVGDHHVLHGGVVDAELIQRFQHVPVDAGRARFDEGPALVLNEVDASEVRLPKHLGVHQVRAFPHLQRTARRSRLTHAPEVSLSPFKAWPPPLPLTTRRRRAVLHRATEPSTRRRARPSPWPSRRSDRRVSRGKTWSSPP